MAEVLPYLEVSKNEQDEIKESVEMPNVTGLTLDEAIKALKEAGLEYKFTEGQDGGMIVVNQLPKKGIVINTGTKVVLSTNQ